MMYTIVSYPEVEATFRKMGRKDAARFEQLIKKLRELGENPEIGKPLHRPHAWSATPAHRALCPDL
jgi:mRNA-degrading endonuclease RelE of RelBE toxin-antitoxin system